MGFQQVLPATDLVCGEKRLLSTFEVKRDQEIRRLSRHMQHTRLEGDNASDMPYRLGGNTRPLPKQVRKLARDRASTTMTSLVSSGGNNNFESILRAAKGEITSRKPYSALDNMGQEGKRNSLEMARQASITKKTFKVSSASRKPAPAATLHPPPKRSISFEKRGSQKKVLAEDMPQRDSKELMRRDSKELLRRDSKASMASSFGGSTAGSENSDQDDEDVSEGGSSSYQSESTVAFDSERPAAERRRSSAKTLDDASLFASLSSTREMKVGVKHRSGLKAALKSGGGGASKAARRGKVRFGKPTLSSRLACPTEALIQSSKYLNGEKNIEADAQRFQRAYERFLIPPEQELSRDLIPDVVRHLGYAMLSAEATFEVLDTVAPFATLDPSEFLDFMEAYILKETEAVKHVFEEFDEDGSGDISSDELMKFMVSLGFTPLQDMVKEAMELADADGSGTLDYDEMWLVISNYRKFEGFTRGEVAQMEVVFDSYCGVGGDSEHLEVDKLAETLIEIFGAAHKALAADLQLQATRRAKAGKSLAGLALAEADATIAKQQGLNYQEFLQWARRLREAEIESYRPLFKKVDADNSGYIDHKELRSLLSSMGLTPLKSIMERCIDLVDKNRDGEINFEEFVNLMGILRRSEGFSDEELLQLEEIFLRFDNDNSGEIDTLEILNVMRHLGFVMTLDEAHRLVAEVDANDSGAVDFREFLHLHRVWREHEIKCLQEVFDKHADPVLRMIESTADAMFTALDEVGHEVDAADQTYILHSLHIGEDQGGRRYCDFDEFLAVADKTRSLCAERRAKYAGLTKSQISSCRTVFQTYLKEGETELSVVDLADVLRNFGWAIKTKEEQQQIVRKLEEAREACRRAGVQESEICTTKGKVSWWVFLQLAGWLSDEENTKRFAYEMEVLEETDFTTGQVTRFHRIFEEWARLEFIRSSAQKPKRRRSITQFVAAPCLDEQQQNDFSKKLDTIGNLYGRRASLNLVTFNLSAPTLRLGCEGICLGLSSSMGIYVKAKERAELQAHMIEVRKRTEPNFEAAPNSDAVLLDFPEFLFVLRWVLNRNFAGVKDVLLLRKGFVMGS